MKDKAARFSAILLLAASLGSSSSAQLEGWMTYPNSRLGFSLKCPLSTKISERHDRNYEYVRLEHIENTSNDPDKARPLSGEEFVVEIFVSSGDARTPPACKEIPNGKKVSAGNFTAFRKDGGDSPEGEGDTTELCIDALGRRYLVNGIAPHENAGVVQIIIESFRVSAKK